MFAWLRELLEIRQDIRERKAVCQSCEVLKSQLTRANFEKDQLLRELISNDEQEMTPAKEPEIIVPKAIHWRIKQAELEAEDRVKAAALAQHKKDVESAKAKIDTNKLEASIGIGDKDASL